MGRISGGQLSMARAIHKLSAIEIQRTVKKPGYYSDGGNLYFRIAEGGTRGWIFRFVSPLTGKTRDMGLGVHPDINLAKARERAAGGRRRLSDGIDPIEDRKEIRLA